MFKNLKDEQARQAIINDLDTCLMVEAGAGSGKTRSLVQRMVALIKEGRCQVDTIAAITFTRKAAAELKERFQLSLEEAFARETDPLKKERLDQALGKLERCFLGTIHSFCAALLRERPVEAGVDPSFEEIEELDDALLRKRAWDEYLLEVQVNQPEALAELDKIGCEPADLFAFFDKILTYPEVEIVTEAVPEPDLSQVKDELICFLDWAENLLPAHVPPKGWDDLQELINKGNRYRRIFDLNDPLQLIRLLNELDRKPRVVKNRWDDKDAAESVEAAFKDLKDSFLLPALQQWREYCHYLLVSFILPAVEYYQNLKAEKSKLNYDDLLLRTASLLKENPEVRRYFQERFTHLLVDEFQDTDPIQAEILFYLTGEELNERDWRRLTPKAGSLFMVGDPKQSIYRFRRADIDIYNEVKRLLQKRGGRVLTLTTNFRSVKAVGCWINGVFKGVFPEESDQYQAAFAPLNTVRDDGAGCLSGVMKFTLPKVARHRVREIVELNAEQIACFIQRGLNGCYKLCRTPEEKKLGITEIPQPGDFMILLRNKHYMDLYARALEERNIPYQIAGGSGFTESQEMRDILNVFQAVLDQEDPVCLLAVLRSQFFGVSDYTLWKLKKAGGCFHIDARLPSSLDPQSREILNDSFERLRRYRSWVQQLPASAAVAKIISDLGAIPYAIAGQQGKARAGYLVQSLELLASAERRGIASFSELVSYLEMLMEKGIEEEIDLYPGDENAVRLMNLHKAKGLEAPVVILANPGQNVDVTPSQHISREGDYPRGYFLIEKRKQYKTEILGQPLNWDNYCRREEEYLNAEEMRLLYVAATRAKNLLVVSTYPEKPQASPWFLFNEHLTDVPVLDDEDSSGMINLTAKKPSLKQVSLDEARSRFLNKDTTIKQASYHSVAVTDVVKSGKAFPKRVDTGRGFSWGRVIHRVLEFSLKKEQVNLELLIENLLIEEGRPFQEKDEVLKYVRGIMQSPFWKRVLRSSRRFVEVPFSQRVADLLPAETLVSGVIDLVFQEEKGWVIVDYKTDTVSGKDELNQLVDYYGPQLDLYRRFWEEITGETVVETGFYFTSINEYISR
ncbi:MAG TPA: UvrD-helicase domain-containing protein [Syntrophomonadaceae bacterium]|nr:UvrD-helicase domain-containing protein [Syntrophomonadaceae bacterium]